MFRLSFSRLILIAAGGLFSGAVLAQTQPGTEQPSAQSNQQLLVQESSPTQAGQDQGLPSSVTVPAGVRVMMVLTSPLHTTSGTEGSGIYLETLYPLVQGNRIVIPAHTMVQGTVESNKRPGHLQRTAEFRFRFTTLIFPNNHVVTINGALQSIPGSRTTRTKHSDGTLGTVDQTEKVVTPSAAGAVSGALLGSVTHFGIGTYVGAGLGAGLGLGAVLLQRGDAISLHAGTTIEMVLNSPLSLDPEQVAFNAHYVAAPRRRPDVRNVPPEDQQDGSPRNPSTQKPPRLPWPGGIFLPWYERR
jgi:type IV secretion system protein VirB10